MAMRSGGRAFIIGIPSLLVPLILGNFIQTLFEETLTKPQIAILPILIASYGTTTFPVVASLLTDLQILNSELGRLGLSSALLSDMFGIFIIVTSTQAKKYNENPSRASAELAALILLFLVVLFVFRPAMVWIIKQTPEGMPVNNTYIQAVIFLALSSIVLSNCAGHVSILGPYILGLAVPDGAPLASTLVDKIECIVSDVFMPILVFTCALRADVSKLSASFDDDFTKLNIIIMSLAFTVKIVSCLLSSRYCNLPFKDSLALSLIMSSKGYVELLFYTLARDTKSIDNGVFGCCIIFILFHTILVPVTVKRLYDPSRKYGGYQNRNIMHLNPTTDELGILVCIHRNGNINGIIHLLNLSCPTINSPLAIHILHLIELTGRAAPIFISHKLQNNNNPLPLDNHSRHIIHSFNQFEKDNNLDTVYLDYFTAISPCKLMHDDVCTLALDKSASLIILPFHRTWTVDGYIDDKDDPIIRILNYSLLQRAPCSVGIFVNLGRTMMLCRSYSVCVIFLGGKDDREAISYAKRMVTDSRVNLTLLRLKQSESNTNNNWEDLVDEEIVRDFKVKCLEDESVMYRENVCNDGQETALLLRQILDTFDLIIVGRRDGLQSSQTLGLTEWNEFPELGVLGDLIVSTDINNRASLLVIQQQQIIM